MKIGIIWLAMCLAAAMLVGCSAKDDGMVLPTPQAVEAVKPKPPAEAMVPCAKATPLDDDSFGAVVRKLGEVLGLLEECSGKQGQLVDFVKKPAVNPKP